MSMKRMSQALALVAVLVTAAWLVQAASPAGRRSCVVSNERTGLGSRSLQEAVDASVAGDTLFVKGTCVGNSTIDKDLTLTGVDNKAFGLPTLDGSGFDDSVLVISGGVTATVSNITIANGDASAIAGVRYSGFGGGIRNFGSLTLAHSTVTGSTSSSQPNAIAQLGASLTLTDSSVSGNEAGGIWTHFGSVTLVRSTINDNTDLAIDGLWAGPTTLTDSTVSGNGGGIGCDECQRVTLNHSVVSGNQGAGLAGGSFTVNDSIVSDNTGPGIYLIGGGTVLNNSVVSDNGLLYGGGGIRIYGAGVTLNNSTVSGNTADYGGGIYLSDFLNPGLLTLADSTISGNTATIDGGGIYNIADDVFPPVTFIGANTFSNNSPNDCVGVVGC
jgi:Right handed beta helix region